MTLELWLMVAIVVLMHIAGGIFICFLREVRQGKRERAIARLLNPAETSPGWHNLYD